MTFAMLIVLLFILQANGITVPLVAWVLSWSFFGLGVCAKIVSTYDNDKKGK